MRAILTYHSVDASGSVVSIEEETFARHIESLEQQKIRVVAVDRLLELPEEVDAVAITFDDAFENFQTRAWPILRARGYPVTLFVATDTVGGTNAWERGHARVPECPLLDWTALRGLAADGVRLGAHSASHVDLTRLDDAALARELSEPAGRLHAETGQEPDTFAYPYGAHDERVVAATRRLYDFACTTELRVLGETEDPLRLPRLDMWYFRRAGQLDGWGSRGFRSYLMLRGRLRSARRLISKGKGQ